MHVFRAPPFLSPPPPPPPPLVCERWCTVCKPANKIPGDIDSRDSDLYLPHPRERQRGQWLTRWPNAEKNTCTLQRETAVTAYFASKGRYCCLTSKRQNWSFRADTVVWLRKGRIGLSGQVTRSHGSLMRSLCWGKIIYYFFLGSTLKCYWLFCVT